MARLAILPALVVLVLVGAGLGPSTAAAHPQAYRLHVEGHVPFVRVPVDIDVPWDADKDASPLDFTDGAMDRSGIDCLGRTWSALQRRPEGESVTIETDDETIRAWREPGYLVLEPHHRGRVEWTRTRVSLPDPIVEAMLAHDGKLSERDIARLASGRDRLPLVKVKSGSGDLFVWVGHAAAGDEDSR